MAETLYTPAQELSHELHAGRLKTDCLFCHRHPEESRVAGIPSLYVCMPCHQSVPALSPEMQNLLTNWNEQKPIA
jgi:hypothetical protein